MTVLVTGGAGYIGSHMVLDLMKTGEEIVVLDDFSTGFPGLVPAGVRVVEGDIGNRKLLERLIPDYRIDAIAHFAAKIVVPESVDKPLFYYDNNTSRARTLIEAAVNGGVKHFIFSSTAAVYGNAETMPVTEETPPNPVSPYGRSKLMVEWMLEDARVAYGIEPMILRYFNVAGADPLCRSGQATPRATHLIKTAVEAAVGKRAGMSIFGTDYPTADGTCVRDYIHVSDLANAHVLALKALVEAPTECLTMNCGYGRGFSVTEVLDAVDRVADVKINRKFEGRRAGDPDALTADNCRIRARLPWTPAYEDLDTIVTHALAWEKELQRRAL